MIPALAQVVIYRSRGEQELDNFIQDAFWPWVAEHQIGVLLFLAAFVCGLLWLNAKHRPRY